MDRADVVVAGAGIAGVATAFNLLRRGAGRVVVCDPRPPLTLTSDKSTECYRNWWPGPGDHMVRFMNRSIDILDELDEESGHAFNMSRRGYLFVTGETDRMAAMLDTARSISALGAGDLRAHRGGSDGYSSEAAIGADFFGDGSTLRKHFPFVGDTAVGGIHVRRAGWISAQQLGSWMLEWIRGHGGVVVTDEVVDFSDGVVTLAGGDRILTGALVLAVGPMLPRLSTRLGSPLPLVNELHLKVAFRDPELAVPRDAPMFIWSDRQKIAWTDEERSGLAEMGRDDLLGEMPTSCHGRPEGGEDSPWVLGLWEYHRTLMEPAWPLPTDELYPEAVLRGLTTMIPALGRYRDRLPYSVVDGGYYTKTPENRPLAGPLPTPGLFVVGALSGFGIMASSAAAELCAIHLTGGVLPAYAEVFMPSRYEDAAYRDLMASQTESGQI